MSLEAGLQATLNTIARYGEGMMLPVPVGATGVARYNVESLAKLGYVTTEWRQIDPSGEAMGWCVRVTDKGLKALGTYPDDQIGSAMDRRITSHNSMGYGVPGPQWMGEAIQIIAEASRRKLIADMKLKSGDVIPSGSEVEIEWNVPGFANRLAALVIPGRPKKVPCPITSLYKYVSGISKPPTTARLEKMMDAAVVTTPTGQRVEPDGTGPDGSPSWLLVLGMI